MRALGSALFGARVGFWAGIAFLTLPITSALGLFASTDAPLLFLWALGMLLLWRALEHGSPARWLGVGIVAGVGLMAKYSMLAFVGSAFLALLAEPRWRRQLARPAPWVGLLVGVAILAPNLVWNWQHGFPTFQHTAEITRVGARGWHPDEFVELIGAQWLAFGPLLMVLLLWALVRLRDVWPDPRFRFLLAFVVPLLAGVCVQALTGRANGNWTAPVFIGASIVATAFVAQRGRPRLAIVAIALNACLGIGLYHWPDIVPLAGRALDGRSDPYKRARGWGAMAEAVRPQLAAHPDAVLVGDERELLAQLIYGLRPARHARWQASDRIIDHYGLTVPLTTASGDPVLFVSSRRDIADVTTRFASARKLCDVDVAVYQNFHRTASIWLLHGFQGY